MAETLVKPSAVIKYEVINLPPVDQFMIRVYMDYILCFRLDPDSDPHKVYSDLCYGLSDALVEFPFFAGRIIEHDTMRDRIQINISSDNGVSFKYNDLTSLETQPCLLDFDDLEQTHFPPSKFEHSLLPTQERFPTKSNIPALLLQANFIKGGLLLGFSPHHSTSDAAGWTGLIRSWAKHTAAATQGSTITPNQSFEISDRSPLFQISYDLALENCEQLVKVEDPTVLTNALQVALNNNSRKATPMDTVNSFWYFSPERLRALKIAAQSTEETPSWVSTNDALCALFWRHLVIARKLTTYDTTSFQTPCNIRGRLSPKLHRDYVGNAVVHAHLSYPIEELCSKNLSLPTIASAIQKAIDRIDEPLVRNVWGIIDSLPTMRSARYNINPRVGVFMSTLADYDWYGFDWGTHMGRMARLRNPMVNQVAGVTVQPRLRDGGLEIFASLEPEVFEQLRLDETFMTFAEVRCY